MLTKYKGYVISCFWGNWYAMGKEFDTLDECKEYINDREGKQYGKNEYCGTRRKGERVYH